MPRISTHCCGLPNQEVITLAKWKAVEEQEIGEQNKEDIEGNLEKL